MPKKKKKSIGSLFLTVVFFTVVCYLCISFFNLRAELTEKEAEIAAVEQLVANQNAHNKELSQLLNNDNLDAFVEKRARDEDLGYVYPDERIYYDMAAEQP